MILIVILRAVVSPAKALIPAIRPLLSAALQDILHTVSRVFPHAEQGLRRKREQGSVLLCVCVSLCLAFIYSDLTCSVYGHAFINKSGFSLIGCSFAKLLWRISWAPEVTTALFLYACGYFQTWPVLCLRTTWCSVRRRTQKSLLMDRPLTPNSELLLQRDSSTSTGWLNIIQEGMLCRGFTCSFILPIND